jgi:hypothetical protein
LKLVLVHFNFIINFIFEFIVPSFLNKIKSLKINFYRNRTKLISHNFKYVALDTTYVHMKLYSIKLFSQLLLVVSRISICFYFNASDSLFYDIGVRAF